MGKVLVLYAHPNPNQSKINRQMALAGNTLDHVQVRDLYETYPDFHIDGVAEQKSLKEAQAVVFQFPIYWFNAPAIIREWQDTVLSRGFAFGPGGTALQGKGFMLAVTTGGGKQSYAEGQPHGAPIEDYLRTFEQTARFCGMNLLKPFIVQGVGSMTEKDVDDTLEAYKARLSMIARETS